MTQQLLTPKVAEQFTFACARPMGRTSGATPSTAKSTPLGEGHMFKEGDLRRRAFLPIATIAAAATQFGVFGTARAQSDQSKPDEDTTTSAVTTLPDHAPVPRSAMDLYAALLFQFVAQQLSVAPTRRTLQRIQTPSGGHLPSPAALLAIDPSSLRQAASWPLMAEDWHTP